MVLEDDDASCKTKDRFVTGKTGITGGEVKVESPFDQGATDSVSLYMPVRKTKEGIIESPVPDDAAQGDVFAAITQEIQCVLLVDDYAPSVMVASIYLEQFGFECDVAENGLSAIEKVRKRKYNAILMDVQMRELDGYQATRAIRQYEKETNAARTRVIGMTAHALRGDRQKCLDAGMDDYLDKPYQLEEMKNKLAG